MRSSLLVNSRLYAGGRTGIPSAIQGVYREVVRERPDLQLTFLQPSLGRVLGATIVVPLGDRPVLAPVFDLVVGAAVARGVAPDVYHSAGGLLPLRLPGHTKAAVTVYDLSFLRFPEHYGRGFLEYYRRGLRRSIERADVVLATSQLTGGDIGEWCSPHGMVEVVPLGIDRAFLDEPHKAPERPPEPFVLVVTTHPRRKNVLGVLDAVAHSRALLGTKIVVVGSLSDEHVEELRRHGETKGLGDRLVIEGFVSFRRLLDLYDTAGCLAYVSFYEGFGFPVLEAMARGCPVLTTRGSAMSELIVTGCVEVDPRSDEELQAGLEHLMQLSATERARAGEVSRARAVTMTWAKSAEETLRALGLGRREAR